MQCLFWIEASEHLTGSFSPKDTAVLLNKTRILQSNVILCKLWEDLLLKHKSTKVEAPTDLPTAREGPHTGEVKTSSFHLVKDHIKSLKVGPVKTHTKGT